MLKEIYEQPTVLQNTFGGRFAGNGTDVTLDLSLEPTDINRVVITAAGTAFYAGLVGEYLIERLARLPVEVEVASEFRYREPVLDARTLCVVVSQSGETIDTLEALREAKRGGAKTLAVLNVKGSSISREADDVLYIHAGPEIGVASTKAYMAMVAAFELLSIWLGRSRGTLSDARAAELIRALRGAPKLVEEALSSREHIADIAERFKNHSDYLFLGRGINFPHRLRGCLKAQRNLLYPRRSLRHGRDEARPDCAHRRHHARGRGRHRLRALRKNRVQLAGGEGARRDCHRPSQRG